jgi:hypothetical protein
MVQLYYLKLFCDLIDGHAGQNMWHIVNKYVIFVIDCTFLYFYFCMLHNGMNKSNFIPTSTTRSLKQSLSLWLIGQIFTYMYHNSCVIYIACLSTSFIIRYGISYLIRRNKFSGGRIIWTNRHIYIYIYIYIYILDYALVSQFVMNEGKIFVRFILYIGIR